ncbi:MAG TPA: hypothetical protein PKY22_04370, partial [Accumulibacter sp.]|nr:hypothetical protein [Accumulibacter sp.]
IACQHSRPDQALQLRFLGLTTESHFDYPRFTVDTHHLIGYAKTACPVKAKARIDYYRNNEQKSVSPH